MKSSNLCKTFRPKNPMNFYVAVFFILFITGFAWAQSRLYTIDADFNEGLMTNVNHDLVHDQLQLNAVTILLPISDN